MKTYVIAFFLILNAFSLKAQDLEQEKQAIKKQIEVFFKALASGDSTLIKTTLDDNLTMATAFIDREGNERSNEMSREQFLKAIGSKKPEDKYFEKLLSYEIHIDANLASVWTPYEFYLNDAFSHCGANSFQMVRKQGKWKIVYLIDSRRRNSCQKM